MPKVNRVQKNKVRGVRNSSGHIPEKLKLILEKPFHTLSVKDQNFLFSCYKKGLIGVDNSHLQAAAGLRFGAKKSSK